MPLLQALRDLGGSATPTECKKKIIENEHLTDEVINETNNDRDAGGIGSDFDYDDSYFVYKFSD